MNNVNLENIIQSIASGDHQAFRMFYDLHYLQVYRSVRYFLPDRYDCELVVADIFCIIWEKRHLLPGIENMKAYLYRVCKNTAVQYATKNKDMTIVSIDDVATTITPKLSPTVIDKMTEGEMMQVYKIAVNSLPSRCKQIFLMVREDRLSHREVAEILDITPGTIEVQMNIAIKRILHVVQKSYPKLIKR